MSASTREIVWSRHITVSITAASIDHGMSFFTVERAMTMGVTRAATPTMSNVLKMLLPTTLPTARSGVPFSADIRLTKNSGIEVPMATMVSPITICGTFSL